MTSRQFFSESYESFCNKVAPFEIKEDFRRAVRSSEETQQIILKQLFWDKAKLFFDNLPQNNKKPCVSDVHALLDASFIVGEMHHHTSPKRFLIENMQTLKEAGFTTLYLEHLYYDDQKLLDEYFETGVMHEKLKQHLDNLDNDHYTPDEIMMSESCDEDEEESGMDVSESPSYRAWRAANFTALVCAARAAGIRVVAIDIKAVYESQQLVLNFASFGSDSSLELVKRIQSMNYTAQAIIKREEEKKIDKASKWVALMGNAHANTQCHIPGVADIFGTPAVYVFDAKESELPAVSYGTSYQVDVHTLACDVCIIASKDAEAIKLQQPKMVNSLI